jgi:DNA polymerase III subunit delta'
MPFRAEELRQRFAHSIEMGRLGHSYLLTGDHPEALEQLALGLAGQVLNAAPQDHPDFHAVRPQSKSRQITFVQVRELERELYLRPFIAPVKVAVIFDADRMCHGAAPAANAFLKTLEEPPAHTLILLTSSRPALLLPTILSRCLRLDLGFSDIEGTTGAAEPEWIGHWQAQHPTPALRAYARAQVLHEHWADLRETVKDHAKNSTEEDEDVAAAMIEAEFLLARQESIAHLQRWYWRKAAPLGSTEPERMRAVKALEDLQAALMQNVDANLAVEVCCLRMEELA